MTNKDWSQLNGLALAYVGDAIFEIHIREHLVKVGQTRPNQLHRMATKFVSARSQAKLIQGMLAEEDLLTEEEIAIYKRGRNGKSHTLPKNVDMATYRTATGFEALMGFLHLDGQKERVEELVDWCIQFVEGSREKSHEK